MPVDHPQRLSRSGAAAAALVVASILLLGVAARGDAAPARAAANSATFPDSVGEDVASADISSVTVANDDRPVLTFRVAIANRPTLTGDMVVLVWVDSDANPSSGDPDTDGADYLIELDGPFGGDPASIGLFRWNGTTYTAQGVPQTSLVFSYANGVATIRISATELGGTRRLSLGVMTAAGITFTPEGEPDFSAARFDLAPDAGRGFYTYDVRVRATLAVRSGGSRPARPAAGKAYAAFATVARSDGAPVRAATVACRATIAGRAIPLASKSFSNGRATCVYRIPKTARGKQLRGTITVAAGGLRATRSYSARVA